MENKDRAWSLLSASWDRGIVKNENAPQLYSRLAINIFTILFSPIFGGILLAMNVKSLKRKTGIPLILGFSVAFTAIVIIIVNLVHGNSTVLTVGLNGVGAVVLYNYFWNKYIGYSFEYRTKAVWIPLAIATFICALLFAAIMLDGQAN